MDPRLPDKLLNCEVDRRYQAFGAEPDAGQRDRRVRILRQALEPAWRDVHRYGPAWARRTIVLLNDQGKNAPLGAPPPSTPGSYAATDLRSVLHHLGEYL